jgi:uncharacterized protein YjbI with pentapeptide repeats
MKKSAAIIFAMMLISASAAAQSRIDAGNILRSIDDGKTVGYRNVEILGDLDLTSIRDMVPDKDDTRSRNSTRVFWYHVRTPLIFVDCTFRGDVIAYRHDDRKNETHNAVFHEDVSFRGCEFRKASAFKYSKFHKGADFSSTTYHEEALFKYTEFSTEVSFAGSVFTDDANFKYTEFTAHADFRDTGFKEPANFKYTEFPGGVSFLNAVFQGDANFKYAEFSEPFDFDGTEFEDSVDFKYTKLEGKSFSLYLLKNRK